MRNTVWAALFAAASLVVSTQAEAADVFSQLTSQRLSDVLTAAGAKDVQVTKPEAGVEVVSFSDGKGSIDFVLLKCEAGGCGAMQMMVIFNADPRFTLAAINSFNAQYLNAKAVVMKNGNIALVDFYLPAGGVTEDNLKMNMSVFLESPQLFADHILSQVTAAAEGAGAKPVAAEASGLKMGIETQSVITKRGLDALK